MFFKMIMWLSIIWILPIMYFMRINDAKFKKNIAVGVTFREEGKTDKAVLDRLERYKKHMKLTSLLMLFAVVPGVLLDGIWSLLTYWLVWIDAAMIAYFVPYYLCNRDLRKIKREKGWMYAGENKITVDIDIINTYKKVSSFFFIIPAVLCLLPLVWEREMWMLYVISALSVILFTVMCRYFYRNRSEAVNDERELTKVLTQVRRHNWAKVCLIGAWSMAAISFSGIIFPGSPTAALIMIVAVSAIVCAAVINIEFKVRKIQEKLTAGSGTSGIVDEDDKWIWGMFYYNPNDSHLFINERTGNNVTINLARTAGKVIAGLTAAIMLAFPLTGPVLYFYYEEPIAVEVTEGKLIAGQGISEYVIELEDIEKADVVYELPKNLVRLNGTSLHNILKGRFRVDGENMTLLLNPQNPPFVKITDKGGKVYLLGYSSGNENEAGKLAESLAP